MLTTYRRHRTSCKQRTKGRKHRYCQCPIWVDGFLAGKEIRESLKLRDWQRAQELVREREAEDRRTRQTEHRALALMTLAGRPPGRAGESTQAAERQLVRAKIVCPSTPLYRSLAGCLEFLVRECARNSIRCPG